LFGSDQRELAEALDAAELYLAEMGGGIEVVHRCAYADGEFVDEVVLQAFDAGAAGHQIAEEYRWILANRGNDAQSGDNDASGHG
jgi:hypothetical protein